MKTIVKLVAIHDGQENVIQNGDYLYVTHYPKAEAIITEFLNDGWILLDRTQRVTPAIQGEGSFSFYMDGWDCLFSKQVADDAEDRSDEFLENIIKNIAVENELFEDEDLGFDLEKDYLDEDD